MDNVNLIRVDSEFELRWIVVYWMLLRDGVGYGAFSGSAGGEITSQSDQVFNARDYSILQTPDQMPTRPTPSS
jgi:hypothetical protein